MAEYRAQLLAVEAKLSKDPDNEELLSLKADLTELIQELSDIEEEEQGQSTSSFQPAGLHDKASSSRRSDDHKGRQNDLDEDDTLVDGSRRKLSEAEILARKKEKNKKKKAKLRERMKEQSDLAENEKKSWQSFANKKGLKGVTKKSIFASPCSVSGKVGVGTNGIADAPQAASSVKSTSSAGYVKRKY